MAGIDKTYIDGKEYALYRQWWIDNYDNMVKEMGCAIWMYPFEVYYPIDPTPKFLLENNLDVIEYTNRYDFAIWNTSETWDKWLIKNCNIKSFRDRMLECYNYNWIGFKGQKWVPKPKLKPKYKR